MTSDAVSVVGLGKVGVTLVAALATAGYRVTEVDVVESQVKALNDGSFRTNEPGVMERLARLKPGQFLATMDSAEAVRRSSVSFIIVPTPSNTLGGFSNRLIIEALQAIGPVAQKSGSHIVSVVSTVLPKSSSAQLIPALEQAAAAGSGSASADWLAAEGRLGAMPFGAWKRSSSVNLGHFARSGTGYR
jgi:UDPglucose 6-dehydrogenase